MSAESTLSNLTTAKLRYRLAAASAVAHLVSKGVSLCLTIASVKLTISYLGPERFGMWMTVVSFVAVMSFLDLGLGNAMTNRVARFTSTEDTAQLRKTIAGGLTCMAGVALAAALLIALAAVLLPWGWLIKGASSTLEREAQAAGVMFGAYFGVNMLFTAAQKVFLGLQRSYESHLIVAACNILYLAVLFPASIAEASVPGLIGLALASQLLGALALIGVLWKRRLIEFRALGKLSAAEFPHLVRSGSLFLALQIGTMVGWGLDAAIVSATLGATHVAVFSVVQRLFSLASTPVAIINQPLWGAYADAHSRGDRVFIKKTLIRSLSLSLATVLLISTTLLIFHQPVIEHWTDGSLSVPVAFLIAYAAWTVIEACATSASMYMNGCAILRPQLVAVICFCILSIPLKVAFSSAWGLTGVVAATIVAYIVAVPVLYAMFFRAPVTAPLRGNQ